MFCSYYQLTDAVENVAYVLHCAARSNLTMDEKTIMRLIVELTKRLNSLIKEFSKSVSVLTSQACQTNSNKKINNGCFLFFLPSRTSKRWCQTLRRFLVRGLHLQI